MRGAAPRAPPHPRGAERARRALRRDARAAPAVHARAPRGHARGPRLDVEPSSSACQRSSASTSARRRSSRACSADRRRDDRVRSTVSAVTDRTGRARRPHIGRTRRRRHAGRRLASATASSTAAGRSIGTALDRRGRARRTATRSCRFAPLHLPVELAAIEASSRGRPTLYAGRVLRHRLPPTLPEVARRLPLPTSVDRAGIRRYGFHGLSYEYVVDASGADARPEP